MVKAGARNDLAAPLKPLPPQIPAFDSNPSKITAGQTVTLHWSTQNTNDVRIDPAIGSVPAKGAREVAPDSTTTYVLTAGGPGGSRTAKVHVRVESISADTQAINETLARFKGAYDSMDIKALRREWPALSDTQADALRTIFLGLRSVRLEDNCDGLPTFSGDTAKWTCAETIAYLLKDPKQMQNVRNTVVFHFRRDNGRWHIESREAQARK